MEQSQFYTMESMLTLAGSVGVVTLVCNSLQKAFNFNPKWLGLAIALLISLLAVIYKTENTPKDYIVGIVNGFLIYCSAAGATEIGSNGSKSTNAAVSTFGGKGKEISHNYLKRSFFSSWFN